MTDRLRVATSDGKYEVVQPENGGLYANRYGDRWRELCGDGLVLALAQDVEALRSDNAHLRRRLVEMEMPSWAIPLPPAPVVDDETVERATEAWCAERWNFGWDSWQESHKAQIRATVASAVRAALLAAYPPAEPVPTTRVENPERDLLLEVAEWVLSSMTVSDKNHASFTAALNRVRFVKVLNQVRNLKVRESEKRS